MNAGYAARLAECDWCGRPGDVPENVRRCECPQHEGEELIFCSASCKVAAHA